MPTSNERKMLSSNEALKELKGSLTYSCLCFSQDEPVATSRTRVPVAIGNWLLPGCRERGRRAREYLSRIVYISDKGIPRRLALIITMAPYFSPYSAGIDFSRQNLTSVD